MKTPWQSKFVVDMLMPAEFARVCSVWDCITLLLHQVIILLR